MTAPLTTDESHGKVVRLLLEADPETGISFREADHVAICEVPESVYLKWVAAREAFEDCHAEMAKAFEHGGGRGYF